MPMNEQTIYCLGCFWGGIICGAFALLQLHPTRRRIWVPAGFLFFFVTKVLAVGGRDSWLTGLFAGGGLVAGIVGSPRRLVENLVLIAAGLSVLFTFVWD